MTYRQWARIAAFLAATAIFSHTNVTMAADAHRKILVVVSNGAAMGDTQAKNNLWEVAEPHHVFVMHGYDVDFVSPKGGPVPFSLDTDETDPPGMVSYTIKYERFREKTQRTLTPDRINPKEYAAVFIGGGAGPLFDVATDAKLLSIIAGVYERGGVLGACGHGPGSFSNVKLSSGEYLVRGKRMTGYPNSSEDISKWSKGGSLLPFRVEDALRQRGALFLAKADLPDKNDVVIDQRMVTTMFLSSSALAAQEVVNLLSHSR
jgi:putative intracellular protease/amidase